MGIGSFFHHIFISEEALQAMPTNEQTLYNSYPLWTIIAFAFAVFGGNIASIGLMFKKMGQNGFHYFAYWYNTSNDAKLIPFKCQRGIWSGDRNNGSSSNWSNK